MFRCQHGMCIPPAAHAICLWQQGPRAVAYPFSALPLLCVSFGLAGLDADFISVRMLLLQMAGNITAAQLAQTQVS